MKKACLITLTTALMIMAIFCVGLFIFSGPTDSGVEQSSNCDHEYITTSEYIWWLGSYRTFSKCVKCGEEF